MNATQLFKEGKLQQAIDAQLQDVKKNPTDHPKRLFLFELLAFAGDLDRARKQIDVIQFDELQRMAVITLYRSMLMSETDRRKLFSENKKPQFLGEPPAHVQKRLDAVAKLAKNEVAEASTLLAEANAETPALTGTLNGKPFTQLRDADDLFGTVLEVLSNGVYSWVPLDQVESVTCNPPKTPRDLLWFPAQLRMKDGQSGSVFLPVLYPGSHQHADEALKLGRATDWKTLEGGAVLGVGQRTYVLDDDQDPVGVLEWRELRMK